MVTSQITLMSLNIHFVISALLTLLLFHCEPTYDPGLRLFFFLGSKSLIVSFFFCLVFIFRIFVDMVII
jgi:hypothetical protein